MKLTYFGHACFMLETDRGSIVFDPYPRGRLPGCELPELFADELICSHAHWDHCAAEAVELSGNTPELTVLQLSCFHDECGGAKRGENLISVVEAEGLRIAHFGDIGHQLSDEQLALLGRLDIAMIPVGGVYTLDAEGAYELCCRLSPRTVIPMHYRSGEKGLQNIGGVEEFLAHYPENEITRLASDTLCGCGTNKVIVFN